MDDFMARRQRQLQEDAERFARWDRAWAAYPVIMECIETLRSAGLPKYQIERLFRHAADQLRDNG
jgi:hypothetical protein